MKMGLIILVVLSIIGCVPTPSVAPDDVASLEPNGVFVLCEGLWQQNNAVVSYLAPSQQVRDVVSGRNAGETLGDTGTDLLALDSVIVVVVSTSQRLVVLDKRTGRIVQRIMLPRNQPYRITSNGRDKIWITNLGDDSITELSTSDLRVSVPRVVVGPAPEGICAIRNDLYIGLSGMGDLRKSEAGAGTIVVLRQGDLSVVDTISDVPNVANVEADSARDKVWAVYRNLLSESNALGGVVCIDARTREIIARWSIAGATALDIDRQTGNVYVLHRDGIDRIQHGRSESERVITHRSGNGNDVWYSISYDVRTSTIFVGNARSYVTDGELIEIDQSGMIRSKRPVGINPTACISVR